ncbi:MAG: hypothetical protein RL499_204, partial [Actinomycetota bacterium]
PSEQKVITRYLESVVATYRQHADAEPRARSWRADAPAEQPAH